MKRLISYFARNRDEESVIRRILSENAARYRSQYLLAILCLIVIAGLTAYSAALMKPIVDDVFMVADMSAAYTLAFTVVVVFVVKGVMTYFQSVILSRIGNNIVATYQRRLFDHMLKLGAGFFDKTHSAFLVGQINQNIAGVRDLLNTLVLAVARDFLTLIGLIGVMIWADPLMSLAVFIIGPLALGTLGGYARRVKGIARQEVDLNARVAMAMQETAAGIPVVKAFTMEDQLREKLHKLTEDAQNRANKIARITARTSPLMETLAGFAVAGAIAYGGWKIAVGGSGAGTLTAFMTALLMAYEPAKRLARLRVTLERSLVNARMIYEILDTPPRQRDRDAAGPLELKKGEIAFENVSFHYDAEQGDGIAMPVRVLQDLSFTAEAGKTTALVGPSGGGKTTIIALLQRFRDLQDGTISIDGQDITSVTVRSLRKNIAYVSQQPVLFEGTVRDNLRYADPAASDGEIEEAAKLAQAHDFILLLPQGYDTPLGENGANLSGGQRQRLSIARAIVRDAPILLLDEATSALDNESEALVQSALETLMKGKTTIVIAHRLSTIAGADKIIVIENGRAVDQGQHDELMSKDNSVYARFHALQAGKRDKSGTVSPKKVKRKA